jgi:O-antigen ligase
MGGIFIVTAHLLAWGRRPAVIRVLAFAMVLVSFSAVFLDPASGLLESVGRNPTLTGRTEVWAHVIPLNENPLIGSGYESFWLGERLERMWSIFWWHPNEAHNGYLEVFLNLGWIGVALLGLLIVTGYRTVFAAFRADPEIGSVKVGFFVAAVAYSFSEAGFRELNPIWIFFLLMTTAIPVPSTIPEVESELDFDLADNRTDSAVPIGSTTGLELLLENREREIT